MADQETTPHPEGDEHGHADGLDVLPGGPLAHAGEVLLHGDVEGAHGLGGARGVLGGERVVDVLGQACDLYVQRKLRMGLLDFDDLLLDWRLLLYDCPDLLAEQRARFAHIFVDEYQDVSRLQSTLCDELAQGYRCLTAVGDDAQSIYRFRGADLSNLLSFQARWPDARVLHLSQNFRSRPEIVALCNRSIACNLGGPPRPPMRASASSTPSKRPMAMPMGMGM